MFSISRTIWVPSWWHSMQPCFWMSTHWPWFWRPWAIPLPLGPVPGNSLASGGSISEYQ